MRLVEDPGTAAWLAGLHGGSRIFDWDEGNRTKHLKHDVEPREVEALFGALLVFAGRIIEPAHDESRWLALGQNQNGRHLSLIFTRRGTKLRPISCRSMRGNERRLYEEVINRNKETPSD